jgi:hypothetical protein
MWAIQLARSEAPTAYESSTKVVADYTCGPGAGCAAGFAAYVVLIEPNGDRSPFLVKYLFNGLPTIAAPVHGLPDFMEQLIDAS